MQVLFDYVPGMDLTLLGGTHTRADAASCAMYMDKNGIWRTVAANVLRDGHYIGGVRHTLLEVSRINSGLRSWDLSVGPWSGAATTALNAVGIDGVTNHATTVSDISGAANQNRIQNITIANDNATHAVQVWVRKDNDETRFPQIGAQLNGGGTPVRYTPSINTKTGVFVAANEQGTGTKAVRDGGLWWIVDVSVTNNTSGHTSLTFVVYPAVRNIITGPDTVAAVGSVVIGHCQAELNATFCTSPIMTAASAVTRAADMLFFSYAHLPQEVTAYAKMTELGSCGAAVDAHIASISNSSAVAPAWLLWFDGDVAGPENKIRSYHDNNDGSAVASSANVITNPTVGQGVEVRSTFAATGAVNTNLSISAAAELTGTPSGVNALATAWAAPTRLYLGSQNIVPQGAFAFQAFRILTGTKTLTELRAPLTYIRFTDAEGTAYLSNEKPFPGNRFANWTPDSTPFGQRAARQSDGAETNFRLRDDQTVSFDIPGIPARLVDGVNPHETALRLKYHLENGGTCIVHTGDAVASTYSPCGIAPGTRAQLALTDRRSIEYTLSLQLLNLAATPSRMVARYAEQ